MLEKEVEIFTWFMCVCLYVVGGTDSKVLPHVYLEEVCEVSLIVTILLFFSVRYSHQECYPSRL